MLTDGQRTYLQDGCSEVPNGNLPIQFMGLTPESKLHKLLFNPITPSYPNPNLTKHGLTDWITHYEPDGQRDAGVIGILFAHP